MNFSDLTRSIYGDRWGGAARLADPKILKAQMNWDNVNHPAIFDGSKDISIPMVQNRALGQNNGGIGGSSSITGQHDPIHITTIDFNNINVFADSPSFEEVPIAPTPDGQTPKQIATTAYVTSLADQKLTANRTMMYQDMTSQRSIGTYYTNSTKLPVFALITLTGISSPGVNPLAFAAVGDNLITDGVTGVNYSQVVYTQRFNDAVNFGISLYVPPGSQYAVYQINSFKIKTWREYRL